MHKYLLPVLLALLLSPAPATAEEADEAEIPAAQQVLAELTAAVKARKTSAWIQALGKVPAVYPDAEPKVQKALMRELGRSVKADGYPVPEAAILALVKIGDGPAAWKAGLKSIFPELKREEKTELDVLLLKALYVLHPDAAIDTLLTYMKKGKSLELAAGTLRVLGNYERSRKRVKVLEGIAKVLVANAPGRAWEPSPRWVALLLHIVPSLNALTGQQWDGAEWSLQWREHKKHPEVLFVNPLPEK